VGNCLPTFAAFFLVLSPAQLSDSLLLLKVAFCRDFLFLINCDDVDVVGPSPASLFAGKILVPSSAWRGGSLLEEGGMIQPLFSLLLEWFSLPSSFFGTWEPFFSGSLTGARHRPP